MKPLEEFLAEKRDVTIHTLASYIRDYIRLQWSLVLQENQEELPRMFDKAGEYAYSVYSHALYGPLQEQLKRASFVSNPEFPGHLSSSIEYWGPPEERERCLWSTFSTAQGVQLGTIVTQLFHDHTGFRIPHHPGVFALEETEPAAIIAALSDASIRLKGWDRKDLEVQKQHVTSQGPAWEYSVEVGLADCLDNQRIEISGSQLDGSLALWGRYGWELVTVMPYQQRILAFFKRPAKTNA